MSQNLDTFDDMPIGILCAPDGGGCAYEYIAGERWCGQPKDASIHHVTQTYSHGFVPVREQQTKATFRFPRAVTPPELGWTIDFGYLSKLQGDIPGDDENHGADVSLETIEAVLLAVERNYDPRDHE